MTTADFPFAQFACGWFREKGVPRGTRAEIVHGDHIVELAFLFAQHGPGCMRVFYRDASKACSCGATK